MEYNQTFLSSLVKIVQNKQLLIFDILTESSNVILCYWFDGLSKWGRWEGKERERWRRRSRWGWSWTGRCPPPSSPQGGRCTHLVGRGTSNKLGQVGLHLVYKPTSVGSDHRVFPPCTSTLFCFRKSEKYLKLCWSIFNLPLESPGYCCMHLLMMRWQLIIEIVLPWVRWGVPQPLKLTS